MLPRGGYASDFCSPHAPDDRDTYPCDLLPVMLRTLRLRPAVPASSSLRRPAGEVIPRRNHTQDVHHGHQHLMPHHHSPAPKTLVLSQKEIAMLLTTELAFPAVERTFAALGRDEIHVHKKLFIDIPQIFAGEFAGMPAYVDNPPSVGFKWVNTHPNNRNRHGLPTLMGTFILSDPSSAVPIAIMDGTILTAVRTGCACAVASKYLAKKVPRTLGLIGTGMQARMQIAAHRYLYAPLGVRLNVLVADRDPEAAEKFVHEVGGKVASLEEAAHCDIVCTTTPSREPIVKRKWINPGAHINAIGADSPGKQVRAKRERVSSGRHKIRAINGSDPLLLPLAQELDPSLLKHARVFVDDMEQAIPSGEVNMPISKGILKREDLAGSLGQVVAGLVKGRTADDQITIFDSTGLAVHDTAIARVVYERARQLGVGVEVQIFNNDEIHWPRDA
eukprot:tig00021038_g17537.t1